MKKLLIVITALVAAASPAHADPITAVAAWVGSTFAVGAATAMAITQMAFSFGLSAISQALTKPKRPPVSVEFEVQMGDDLPLSFVAGDYVTAGKRKYIGSWGKNTRFITEVVEISAIPQGLATLWVNDEPADVVPNMRGYVTPGQGGWPGQGTPGWFEKIGMAATVPPGALDVGMVLNNLRDNADTTDRRIWVKTIDGTQTEADPLLLWLFGDDPDYPWTAAMVGRGKSYVIVTTQYDSDTLTSYPTYLFQPAPKPCYDLRLDSTNGGNGPQRWDAPATWQPTRNPAVIAYNIIRGVYHGSEWVYGGKNLPAWRLPSAEWIAAANACDAPVSKAGGGTEPRYRCGMEISVDTPPADVLEEIGKSANMRFAEVGGRIKPLVDLPAAAVFSITDGDILITEGQSLKPFFPVSETYNTISATYPEPGEKWTNKDAPEFVDEAAKVQHKGRHLPVSMSYPAVPFGRQVQRLMRSQMRDYARQRQHDFCLPPDAYALEPGDMLSFSSERNGYVNKLFTVERVVRVAGMNVAVTLRETNPGDYDWSSSFERPITITPPVNPVPFVQVADGFAVAPAIIEDATTKARRPDVLASYAGDEVGVTHIQIRGRVQGQTAITVDTLRRWNTAQQWRSFDLLPATAYEFQALLLSELTPRGAWSAWKPVTTPDVKLDWIDFEASVKAEIDAAEASAQAALAKAQQTEIDLVTVANDAAAAVQQARDDLAVDFQAAIDAGGQAAAASTAAISARDAALGAQAGAETAREEAVAKALAAAGSAGAAAGSASTATSKASEAGDSAAAAASSVTAAQSRAGEALSYRDAAATSATNAAGSATSASQSAGVAVSNVLRMWPSTVGNEAAYWTSMTNGTPEGVPTPTSNANHTINGDGTVTFLPGAGSDNWHAKGAVPWVSGRTYRLTISARARVALPVNRLRARIAPMNASYVNMGVQYSSYFQIGLLDQWVDASVDVTLNASSAAWMRPGIQIVGPNAPTSEIDVRAILIEDVTESLKAGGEAAAAAGHASTASTKSTEAGQSATAAASSASAAETARGAAQTFRDQASASKTDAEGSAASALEQAGLSAGSATLSGQKADAASLSATQASSSATDAAQSAATATTERQAAETARSDAQTFRQDAVTAKNDAESAAAGAQSSMVMAARYSTGATVIDDPLLGGAAWTRFSSGGTLVLRDNERYPSGKTWDFTLAAGQQDGLAMLAPPDTAWTGQMNALGYVVEVEYSLLSGSLDGAGVLLDWNTTTSEFRAAIRLADMTSGSAIPGRTSLARAVFLRPKAFTGTFASHDLFVLAGYPGSGLGPITAKRIKFHRVSIRVATEEEMGAGVVLSNVMAAVSQNYVTKADSTAAIAGVNQTITTEFGKTNAQVSANQNALSNLNGSVATASLLASTDDGSAIAGFELAAWNTAGQGTGAAVKLHGDVVAKGTLKVGALVVGVGSNMLQNSRFTDGLTHWQGITASQGAFAIVQPGQPYAHPGFPTLRITQTGTAAETAAIRYAPQTDPADIAARKAGEAATPGKIYCASGHVAGFRCNVRVQMVFCDAAGAPIPSGGFFGTPWTLGAGGSSTDPDSWPRMYITGTAPPNAAYIYVDFQKDGTVAGQSNSHLYVWKPQVEETHSLKALPALYTSGRVGYWTGDSLFSDTILARHVSSDTIKAINGRFANLAAANIKVGTAEIQGAWIGDLQVDTIKVKNGAMTGLSSTEFGPINTSGSSWVTVKALSFTAFGTTSKLMLGGWYAVSMFADTQLHGASHFRILLNGVEIASLTVASEFSSGAYKSAGERRDLLEFAYGIAGTNTLEFQARVTGAGGGSVVGKVYVFEGKR